jgi:hypothetical protein
MVGQFGREGHSSRRRLWLEWSRKLGTRKFGLGTGKLGRPGRLGTGRLVIGLEVTGFTSECNRGFADGPCLSKFDIS